MTAPASGGAHAPRRAVNVLCVLSDEHAGHVLSCAGHPLVRTPSLDRLAARGTRFTNAYTPSPICVPARASLATGRYVHEIGYWDNAIAYDGRVPGWGHRLQRAGIDVESIGKLHYRSAADPTGFDRQHLAVHIAGGIGQVWGSVRDPLPERAAPSHLFDEIGAGESSYNRYDQAVADRAVEWLRERAARPGPWVLFVGLVAPHFPLIVPQRYLDQYPLERIERPRLHPGEGYRRHPWVERQAMFQDHDAALGSDDRRRLAVASYLGLVSFMDDQVGRILAALEESGLADDTLVVYASDHGDNLGVRGMWNKCLLYRESTCVPLIVAGPGVPRGQTRRTNANLVDIHPTVLDAAGFGPAADSGPLAGRSLRRLAAAPDDPGRAAFSEYHAVGSPAAGYMLARGRFKYHHYVGYAPELFDLEADPWETRDLATDPAYRGVVAACEAELRAALDPEGVDAQAKRDQNALVARFGGRERALATGTPGATPVPA